MNKSFIFFSLFLFSTIYMVTGQSKQANDIIGVAKVKADNDNYHPTHIVFQADYKASIQQIDTWCKETYNEPNLSLNLISINNDNVGDDNYRYQPCINNIPLEYAMLIVHSKNGIIKSVNGKIPVNVTLENKRSINEAAALAYALEHVNAKTYKWQLDSEEKHLKLETNNKEATYFPETELVIFPNKRENTSVEYLLAFKFNVFAHEPMSRSYVYVNAQTGIVLHESSLIHFADVEGTAITAYSDTVTITTESTNEGYRLQETGRGNGIKTYNLEMGSTYGNAVDFIDDDNVWNNVNSELDQYAADAHFATEMTYDYFYNIHGRNSIDGDGFALISYVHANMSDFGVSDVNAFWNGSYMTYGDGNNNFTPLTTLDICGHEITHGLTTFTANLIYADESGAMNEGFSDIFGTAIEFYARPDHANWTIGEDIGSAFRSLKDPNEYNHPDTYHGDNWDYDPMGIDNGGVHTNSGILNYWFYLVSEGGFGTNDKGDDYNVYGVGIENAAKIAFRVLTVYLTPDSDYSEFAYYAKEATVDLFGSCSAELSAVKGASYAIGIGPLYINGEDSDFSANSTSSCFYPVAIEFSNLTSDGIGYAWDFGDGTTSDEENPVHTYDSEGLYTVNLVINRNECGVDTVTKEQYIFIDNDLDCNVILPKNGIAPTQINCSGRIFDNGGEQNNYDNYCNSQITIEPSNAISVSITFDVFDIEEGSGNTCNNDNVKVYDGSSISSPLIGRYCNTTGNPGTIKSSGGSITIVHYSDKQNTGAGFDITWECEQLISPPEGEFTFSEPLACSGLVNFTDQTENHPFDWEWHFGDGKISYEQNPEYEYKNAGLYTITLITDNGIGKDTLIKTNFVKVLLPDDPNVINDTICENQKALLAAEALGNINWYDAEGSDEILFTGPTFETPSLESTKVYYVENAIADGTNQCISNKVAVSAVVDACLAIDEQQLSMFNIYPNPAYNYVFIASLEEENQLTKVQIIDVSGKIVIDQQMNELNGTIDISNMPAGLYYCRIIARNANQTSKLIKR